MRALLTGTDFVKDTDDSFKILEINTNIALQVDVSRYINYDEFDNFIKSNSFDEIHLIYTTANVQIKTDEDTLELEPEVVYENRPSFTKNFETFINEYCSGSGITYNKSKLEDNSVTIPNIEDGDTKLILRISYDTTALIDDIYARDNWEFLKLMNDSNPNSIPKTYINDTELGFDSIGEVLRDNGAHPNYCVKKRITPADNNVYPKLYKIDTLEELANIKLGLEPDEYVQEYVLNLDDTLENKLSHYRSVDMIYGSNLDSLNLMMVQNTNVSDICSDPVYDSNKKVVNWDSPMYKNKFNSVSKNVGVKLSADDATRVLNSNNEIVLAKDLNTGDVVKSLSFNAAEPAFNWSASLDELTTNLTEVNTTLQTKENFNYFGRLISIELEDGLVYSDVPHALLLSKTIIDDVSSAIFKSYDSFNIGDEILIWDNELNQLISKAVTDIKYSFDSLSAYVLDFVGFDTFLTLSENGDDRYLVVTHNYDYDCYMYYCPNGGQYIPGYAYKCGGGAIPPCYYRTACVRVSDGYGPYPNVNYGPAGVFGDPLCNEYYYGCYEGVTGYISSAGWCNNEK